MCGSKKGGGLQTCQEWVHPFNTSMTVKSSSFNPQLKVPQSKITNRLAFTCHTMIGMYSIRAFSGSFSHQTPFLFSIPLYVLSCIKWYSLVVQLLTINTSKIHTYKILKKFRLISEQTTQVLSNSMVPKIFIFFFFFFSRPN